MGFIFILLSVQRRSDLRLQPLMVNLELSIYPSKKLLVQEIQSQLCIENTPVSVNSPVSSGYMNKQPRNWSKTRGSFLSYRAYTDSQIIHSTSHGKLKLPIYPSKKLLVQEIQSQLCNENAQVNCKVTGFERLYEKQPSSWSKTRVHFYPIERAASLRSYTQPLMVNLSSLYTHLKSCECKKFSLSCATRTRSSM